jgi:hypothetical protein
MRGGVQRTVRERVRRSGGRKTVLETGRRLVGQERARQGRNDGALHRMGTESMMRLKAR